MICTHRRKVMDAQIRKIISNCLEMSEEELFNFAKDNYDEVFYHVAERTSSEDAHGILVGTVFVAIAADSGFSESEYDFISQIDGSYSRESAKKLTAKFSGVYYQNKVKEIIDLFPYDIRLAFISLCIAVLSVDKNVDKKELAFIDRLLRADW